MAMRFVNLHHHTTFSFGDGFGPVADHVARAVELGYYAIAATEHGNVSSHFQLEAHALRAGIKPLFGLEAYTGPLDEGRRSQCKYHLTIIAENTHGYQNLNRIVSQSYLDSYYHPTVSGESLAANADGLVVMSGCTGSLLACSLVGGKGIPEPASRDGYAWDDARLVISRFLRLFGSERFFLEVQPFWELEKSRAINTAYAKLAREFGIRMVVTNDVHYPHPDDSEMQAILHAVRRGKHTVEEAMREWNYEVPMTLPESDRALGERLLKTGLTRDEAWGAICASRDIAEMCTVKLPKAERLRYPISPEDLKPW